MKKGSHAASETNVTRGVVDANRGIIESQLQQGVTITATAKMLNVNANTFYKVLVEKKLWPMKVRSITISQLYLSGYDGITEPTTVTANGVVVFIAMPIKTEEVRKC